MGQALKDLAGQRFGRLVVQRRVPSQTPATRWLCLCACGETTQATSSSLRHGAVASCGCLRRDQKQAQMTAMGRASALDLSGQKFGSLTVVARAVNSKAGRAQWKCRCDCGATTVKLTKYLRNGDTRSCGCLQRDYRATGPVKHGGARVGKMTREYRSWRDAKERCFNPSKETYPQYGGRGITMCAEWRADFAAFLQHVGHCPPGGSLDRIDVNGNYEPGNVRWISQREQCNNQRRNVHVMFAGRSLTIAELATETGLDYHAIYDRVRRRNEPADVAVSHLRRLPAADRHPR